MIRICADDYGLAASINAGIEHLATTASISAASVMFHRDAVLDSLKTLRTSPIDVGVHLVFVEERPLTSGPIEALLDDDGRLPASWMALLSMITARPWLARTLRTEAEAQLGRCEDLGVVPRFVNSHQHVHLFPPLWCVLHGLLDRPHWRVRAVPEVVDARGARSVALSAAGRLSWAVMPLRQASAVVPLGIDHAGALNDATLQAFAKTHHQSCEIVAHPGFEDHALRNRFAHWGYRWNQELQAIQQMKAPDILR